MLISLLLISLPWILDRFDLPASLMQRKYILDLSHYVLTLGRILASADKMGVSTVRGWFSCSYESCAAILGTGGLLCALIIALENRPCRSKSKNGIK